MTTEERAFNYASTQKCTKLQVGEIAKHYNNGYQQALRDIQDQAEKSVIEKSNGEVTIEDLAAYNQGFKTGRELAMKDFLQKAELFFNYELYVSVSDQICSLNNFTSMSNFVEYFKKYMQNK